jgi:DNA polymerase-1
MTWNVNSLGVRMPQLVDWLQQHQPDVVCLQETKLEDHQFPIEALIRLGYHAAFSGQKAYNGVALLSRHPLSDPVIGIPGFEDSQRRVVSALVDGIRVVCAYVPNGELLVSDKYAYKLTWLSALCAWLGKLLEGHDRLVVAGDFNIAPTDLDVFDPAAMEGQVLVSPPERAAFSEMLGLGLVDAVRQVVPLEPMFTWWDYRRGALARNEGLRIDHVLVSRGMAAGIRDAWVDGAARAAQRASDHAPVVVDFFEARRGRSEKITVASKGTQGIPDAEEFVPLPGRRLPETRTQASSLLLVDGHSTVFRQYFGYRADPSPTGEAVHAVLGFLRAILKMYRDAGGKWEPSATPPRGPAMVVVFDAPAATFRHEIYAAYKGKRDPAPPDLPPQVRYIKRLIDALGFVRFEVERFEADDAIASLVGLAEGLTVQILSSDRDLYQLLSERVKVLGSKGLIGSAEVEAEFGVPVERWADFRALTGDSSDNIPGARGVGPKTAAKLLATYGTLDNLLAQVKSSSGSAERKVAESLEQVELSRRLVALRRDIPIPFSLEEAATLAPDIEALGGLLSQLGFRGLAHELGLSQTFAAPEVVPRQANLVEVKPKPWRRPVVGFDLDQIVVLNETYRPVSLSEIPREVHGVDAKMLVSRALRQGLERTVGDDPLLMAYIEDSRITNPVELCRQWDTRPWPRDAAGRAEAGRSLLERLMARQTTSAQRIYREIERPLGTVLARMEARGIRVNPDYWHALEREALAQMELFEAQIHAMAGHPFNLASRDQLEHVLFDELGLSSGRATDTGRRSTAEAVLLKLRDQHPIIPAILAYRELAKLVGTYLTPLPRLVSPETGRIHTTFHQTNTATGRLSSLNPNLQNIPVRGDFGRRIRGGFIADEGMVLVAADYSQVELRILAHLGADETLLRAFQQGVDVHRQTAALISGVEPSAVTKAQREAAKAVNYGIAYGLSAFSLAENIGLSRSEASAFIQRYFHTYSGIARYIDDTKAHALKYGWVEDLFGRRRYVPDVGSTSRSVREAAEREAINMPIQGTAASIIKLAMVALDGPLRRLGAHLLLQVHDELVIEAPENAVLEVGTLVKSKMTSVFQLKAPLEVEVGWGSSWLDAK